MPATSTITILLADEDFLRRDGLSAVLLDNPHFNVVASVSDGDAALRRIRELRPDVAVVDLNLAGVHGIELIRRIRSEALDTKIIIVAATSDDDTIREVIRAGGDGYLLKNGPARHLVDAVSYVRDGGQYFSPQLKRDGRGRHLFEEPPRDAIQDAPPPRRQNPPKSSQRRNRHLGDFRERIREEAQPGLADRDYEIMSRMADGIRPILDRLDEIDNRVAQMEVGEAPVPTDPRGWLTNQFADTLRDPRSGGEAISLSRSVNEVEARLPQLIEEAVSRRFHQMADKLQQDIEETHVRTLEAFVKNIQVKLVQRVSALETDMSKQASAMNDLREYSLRTEDNLGRLIKGVDMLAQELPKRLATAAGSASAAAREDEPVSASPKTVKRRPTAGSSRMVKYFWAAVATLAVISLIVWGTLRFARRSSVSVQSAGSPAGSARPAPPAASGGDTNTKMLAAQQYLDREEYAAAEDLYKQVVKAEPRNTEALKALASVLYREDKIDESTSVLDRIPKD